MPHVPPAHRAAPAQRPPAAPIAAPIAALRACAAAAAIALAAAGCGGQAPDRTFARVSPWTLPAAGEAAQPDLARGPGGAPMLSWVEPREAGGHRLRLAVAEAGGWRSVTVAEGDDWFVNWADTPRVFALPDGSLWAHWLRSTGPARMDYGIDLVRSEDGGRSWSAPRLVNLPDVPGDHGFVSFWPQAADTLGIAWLDSRLKAPRAPLPAAPSGRGDEAAHHGHGAGGGAMSLRAALYGADGAAAAEWPLDASTCDCCPTATAVTARGPVVVYRGRDAGEIRDMRLVRLQDGGWTPPRPVHADGWRIAGCPVNGPAVAADGLQVWAAWYTEAGGRPSLRIARSDDAGDGFGPPRELAGGAGVLGRVSLALAPGHVLAAWLEEDGAGQRLRLARLDRALADLRIVEVATLQARGRASGMPRLLADGDAAHLVWVDVENGAPRLRGARVDHGPATPGRIGADGSGS